MQLQRRLKQNSNLTWWTLWEIVLLQTALLTAKNNRVAFTVNYLETIRNLGSQEGFETINRPNITFLFWRFVGHIIAALELFHNISMCCFFTPESPNTNYFLQPISATYFIEDSASFMRMSGRLITLFIRLDFDLQP